MCSPHLTANDLINPCVSSVALCFRDWATETATSISISTWTASGSTVFGDRVPPSLFHSEFCSGFFHVRPRRHPRVAWWADSYTSPCISSRLDSPGLRSGSEDCPPGSSPRHCPVHAAPVGPAGAACPAWTNRRPCPPGPARLRTPDQSRETRRNQGPAAAAPVPRQRPGPSLRGQDWIPYPIPIPRRCVRGGWTC